MIVVWIAVISSVIVAVGYTAGTVYFFYIVWRYDSYEHWKYRNFK